MFDPVQMNQDHHSGPYPDRILVAELTGTARHHARWRELAQGEQNAAVTELRELAGGRGAGRESEAAVVPVEPRDNTTCGDGNGFLRIPTHPLP